MSDALRKLKARCAARRRNLRDPKWQDTRAFPAARVESFTTAEYIARYSHINQGLHLGVPFTFVNINGEVFKCLPSSGQPSLGSCSAS